MSSVDDFHIYTGIGVSWSHGLVVGSTLTLAASDGEPLTLFLATFITVVRAQLWRILSFASLKYVPVEGRRMASITNIRTSPKYHLTWVGCLVLSAYGPCLATQNSASHSAVLAVGTSSDRLHVYLWRTLCLSIANHESSWQRMLGPGHELWILASR
jgi:hypothetical protein